MRISLQYVICFGSNVLIIPLVDEDLTDVSGVATYLALSFKNFNWLGEQVESWATLEISNSEYGTRMKR